MNAIITYIKRILRIEPKQDGITWISAEEDSEDDEEAEEASEPLPPMPMFPKGDTVVLYNPYEGGFIVTEIFAMEPTRFTVVESKYDADEKVFRYRLESTVEDDEYVEPDEWYSEEWLSLPTVSSFVRTREPAGIKIEKEELTMEAINAEGAILAKALADTLDDDLRMREIDRFLDLYRTGTAEERKVAERELRKLTNTKSGGVAE